MRDVTFYLLASVCVAGIASSVLFMNAALLVLCMALAVICVALYKGWYIIEPLVFRHSNVVELLGGYELSGGRTVALRRMGNSFTATAAALLDTSKMDELSKERLEDVIHKVGRPFKLSMVVEPLDTGRITNELRTRQYMVEARLSRLQRAKADSVKVAQEKRKLDEIQRDIEEITSGKTPLRLLYYVMSSSRSGSMVVAREQALAGMRELCNAFDSATGSRSSALSGSELAELLMFDCMVTR